MGIFRKAAPDDALINEFWSWFVGFESSVAGIVRSIRPEDPIGDEAFEAIMILSERMQRICYDTKELVEFEYGGDPDAKLELIFYPYSKYVKNNIARMVELMPAELKEKWDIVICT